jgi:hypothetical protein
VIAIGLTALMAACSAALLPEERGWCDDHHMLQMTVVARDLGEFDAFAAALTEALRRVDRLGDPHAWDWFYSQEPVIASCRAAYAKR